MPSCASMRLLLEISKEVRAKVSIDYVRSLSPEKRAYIEELKAAGYLERCDEYSRHDTGSVVRVMPGYRSLRISDTGWAALASHQEQLDHQRNERADEERKAVADRAHADKQTEKQFRHDWRIALFEVLGGFILGAIADNRFDVIGKAARLWAFLFANG